MNQLRHRSSLPGLAALAAGVVVALAMSMAPAVGADQTPSSSSTTIPSPTQSIPTPSPTAPVIWEKLAGHVTDEDGVPVSGVSVYAWRDGGARSAVTDSSGYWEIVNSGGGKFVIEFVPPAGSELVGEFWDDAATAQTATTIFLPSDGWRTGIDAKLARADVTPLPAQGVAGKVKGRHGPAAGVEVSVVARGGLTGSWGTATTAQDGSFVLGGLPAGTYALKLVAPDGSVRYYKAPAGTTHRLRDASDVKVRTGTTTEVSIHLPGVK